MQAVVDQYEMASFEAMYARFGSEPFDLIIDDGLHSIGSNLNTLIFALEHVKPGGVIVIEDIGAEKVAHWRVVDMILRQGRSAQELDTYLVDCAGQKLYVVERNM